MPQEHSVGDLCVSVCCVSVRAADGMNHLAFAAYSLHRFELISWNLK